jgi:hypothetical protein
MCRSHIHAGVRALCQLRVVSRIGFAIFSVRMIKENEFKHWLDHFYGYGSWQARIWFIAFEEGGGDLPEDVAERLGYFYRTQGASTEAAALTNIRELYREVTFRTDGPRADLFSNLFDYRFGTNAILHGVWKNLISFVHGCKDEKLPDLLSYQKDVFASPTSHEALINLYPLPSPHNHAWYYSWLDMPQFSFLKSRSLYQDRIYESRMNAILQNISKYKPEVVLMYDMNNINLLKKSVQTFFPDSKFKMVKGIKLQVPQHHRAQFNGTTMLITTQMPALRHNRVETGFDWYALGKSVNANQ